ncbi:hypothetical protein G9A89_000534 [Geosiphon pyriformis]|nr:hypothetical protein G9A89_000534 [Geosiphon pyriformis]
MDLGSDGSYLPSTTHTHTCPSTYPHHTQIPIYTQPLQTTLSTQPHLCQATIHTNTTHWSTHHTTALIGALSLPPIPTIHILPTHIPQDRDTPYYPIPIHTCPTTPLSIQPTHTTSAIGTIPHIHILPWVQEATTHTIFHNTTHPLSTFHTGAKGYHNTKAQ